MTHTVDLCTDVSRHQIEEILLKMCIKQLRFLHISKRFLLRFLGSLSEKRSYSSTVDAMMKLLNTCLCLMVLGAMEAPGDSVATDDYSDSDSDSTGDNDKSQCDDGKISSSLFQNRKVLFNKKTWKNTVENTITCKKVSILSPLLLNSVNISGRLGTMYTGATVCLAL